MFDDLLENLLEGKDRIAVAGLGYVGLPLAVALSKRFKLIGFDVNPERVASLRDGFDVTGEVSPADLRETGFEITDDPAQLGAARFIIVCVPTPINAAKRPDLGPLFSASESIGSFIKPGTVVVYESTVYPGATEEDILPVLEKVSGLKGGVDFKLGYSPERINPGDKTHTIEKVIKVVSGQDAQTLDIVAGVYGAIVEAGVHRAETIKVAEAAKVIENIQRDLNIALMNELAKIFDLAGVDTRQVLEAAGTKWNFQKFEPGLVGGHCIGVDPYYLTNKAEELGYHPEVILAGRRINDGMGKHIAEQVAKHLLHADKNVQHAKVGVLGLTFKEDVPDIRNSRVPDILAELADYRMETFVHDPMADPETSKSEHGVELVGYNKLNGLDAVVIAVAHQEYKDKGPEAILAMLGEGGGVVIDVKSMFDSSTFHNGVTYWRL